VAARHGGRGRQAAGRATAGRRGLVATPAHGTAGDLLRFFDALRGGRLVGSATLRELTRPQIDSAPGLQHGLGFGLIRWAGHEGFGHNGGTPGVNRDPPAATLLTPALRRAALARTLCRTAS
jgi:hypothetical protein